jgi:hypothetical protein
MTLTLLKGKIMKFLSGKYLEEIFAQLNAAFAQPGWTVYRLDDPNGIDEGLCAYDEEGHEIEFYVTFGESIDLVSNYHKVPTLSFALIEADDIHDSLAVYACDYIELFELN